jgi:hypothetical protein
MIVPHRRTSNQIHGVSNDRKSNANKAEVKVATKPMSKARPIVKAKAIPAAKSPVKAGAKSPMANTVLLKRPAASMTD